MGKIWKNGIPLPLSGDEGSTINDVFVSENDVYASGYYQKPDGYREPRLWKNGEIQYLAGEFIQAAVRGMYVNGDDVYVVGPYLWKNGVEQYLDDPYSPSKCTSVFVSENNGCMTGGEVFQPDYR